MLILTFSIQAIYTARYCSIGQEKPKFCGLLETKETQVVLSQQQFTDFLLKLNLIFRTPVLVAEYLNGERHWLSLHNMGVDEVGF